MFSFGRISCFALWRIKYVAQGYLEWFIGKLHKAGFFNVWIGSVSIGITEMRSLKKLEIIIKKVTNMIDLKPASPGEILQEEFLKPMNVTAYRLAKEIHIPQQEELI